MKLRQLACASEPEGLEPNDSISYDINSFAISTCLAQDRLAFCLQARQGIGRSSCSSAMTSTKSTWLVAVLVWQLLAFERQLVGTWMLKVSATGFAMLWALQPRHQGPLFSPELNSAQQYDTKCRQGSRNVLKRLEWFTLFETASDWIESCCRPFTWNTGSQSVAWQALRTCVEARPQQPSSPFFRPSAKQLLRWVVWMSGSSVAFVVQACANFSSQQAYPAEEGIHLCHFRCLRDGAAHVAATLVKHFGHVAH